MLRKVPSFGRALLNGHHGIVDMNTVGFPCKLVSNTRESFCKVFSEGERSLVPDARTKSTINRLVAQNTCSTPPKGSRIGLGRAFSNSKFDADAGFRCTSGSAYIKCISPEEFTRLFDSVRKDQPADFIVLDVRSPAEVASKRLSPTNSQGATVPQEHLDLGQLADPSLDPSELQDLLSSPPSSTETTTNVYKTVYCLCKAGVRSALAAELLGSKGFTAVNVEGGILALDHLAVSG